MCTRAEIVPDHSDHMLRMVRNLDNLNTVTHEMDINPTCHQVHKGWFG